MLQAKILFFKKEKDGFKKTFKFKFEIHAAVFQIGGKSLKTNTPSTVAAFNGFMLQFTTFHHAQPFSHSTHI